MMGTIPSISTKRTTTSHQRYGDDGEYPPIGDPKIN
jgi:hypothetical protein